MRVCVFAGTFDPITIGHTFVIERCLEMFDKVVAMGCDIVQGYYYAKAISLEEFKIFINTNTSIKYKSLVK